MARPHAPRTEKVVGIGFQPGFDPYKVFLPLLLLVLLCTSFCYIGIGFEKWFAGALQSYVIFAITDCKRISSWRHSVS